MKGPQDQVVSQDNCEIYRVTADLKFAEAFKKLFEHMHVIFVDDSSSVAATPNGMRPPVVISTFPDGRREMTIGEGNNKLAGLEVVSVSTQSFLGRIIKVEVGGDCPFVVTCKVHNVDTKLLTKPHIVHYEEPQADVPLKSVEVVAKPAELEVVETPMRVRRYQKKVAKHPEKSANRSQVDTTDVLEPQVLVAPSVKGIRIEWVLVDEIVPFEEQPREEFDVVKLNSLAVSLKSGRQRQLITVKPIRGIPGKRWGLVDGERRWRAAKQAGITGLFAMIREYDSLGEQFWDSFIMNLQREGHTPLELSDAFALAIGYGKTVVEICAETGYSNCTVYQHLHLQNLHPDLKGLMRMSVPKRDRLRMSLAHQIARVPDGEEQLRIYNQVREEPNPKVRELNAMKLLRPVLDGLPHRGRKRGPHDRVKRFVRIMAAMDGNVAIMEDMSATDLKCLLSSETLVQDPVAFINRMLVELAAFKTKLIKARTEVRKGKQG